MPLGLFEGYGIEIEYMLVDGALEVLPLADALLAAAAGTPFGDEPPGDVLPRGLAGDIGWSNELVLHVLELKSNGPAPALRGLAGRFQDSVDLANRLLEPLGGRLMPTGAHPWMDPLTQTRLWPHECGPIYQAYDRIFGCQGHGWSNLQSTHINLPFDGDEQFGRLHAAIRVLLPIMPALTASTPVLDGRAAGRLDGRMHYYAHNADRVPQVAGRVVPEAVFSRADYDREIMAPLYAAMDPLDPEGVLHDEFLNARGAIARFGRGSIEIRVLDAQECPAADLACAGLICAVLRGLCDQDQAGLERQKALDTGALASILDQVVFTADQTFVTDAEYLAVLGYPGQTSPTAGELWAHLAQEYLPVGERDAAWDEPLKVILEQGCLSRRILAALRSDFRREKLAEVYGRLCQCLAQGQVFTG